MEEAAIVGHYDINLAQCIASLGFGGQLVFHQFYRVSGDAVDRLIDYINWAISVTTSVFSSLSQINFTDAVAIIILLPDCMLQ